MESQKTLLLLQSKVKQLKVKATRQMESGEVLENSDKKKIDFQGSRGRFAKIRFT